MTDFPAHLLNPELDLDVIGGAFRASEILEEVPDHKAALTALAFFRNVNPDDLTTEDSRRLCEAMLKQLAEHGVLSKTMVKDELVRERMFFPLEVLVASIGGPAPVAGLPVVIKRLEQTAEQRRRFRDLQNEQAKVWAGEPR